jgi:predicted secreted Zn-dependent protease
MKTHLVVTGLAFAFLSVAAAARPAGDTSYEYYNVSGSDAASLHNNMIRRGPHLSGKNAYALTTMRSTQTGRLIQGKTCKVSNYNVGMSFKMKLPKLRDGTKLSGAERGRWNAFAAFVKRHEETHRAIWLGCGRDMERRVAGLRAANCNAWEAAEKKIVAAVVSSCNAKHQAFDAAEQRSLARHPFVRAAFGGGVKAVAAKRRKKASF